MKKTVFRWMEFLFIGGILFFFVAFTEAKTPVRLIFDTDMGNDVDDALALAIIHYFQSRGECELLAVTTTKDNPHVVPYIKMFNNFYGYPDIPVGSIKSGIEIHDGRYIRKVLEARDESGKYKYNPKGYKAGDFALDSVELLRKTLAGIKEGKVIIVQVGFSTNMARLLETQGDEYSPLSGIELVKERVEYLSVMAGRFVGKGNDHREYNVIKDIPAAQKLFAKCPVPVICSGNEVGSAILMPGNVMKNDYNYVPNHPLQESFRLYRGFDKNQGTFDLTSVFYVVRPNSGYFDLSDPGTIKIRDEGNSVFEVSKEGKHRFMKVNDIQIARVREAFIWICSCPPHRSGL